jgi:hypothetical protein
MSDSGQPLGCEAVRDHIQKPIPAKLWHYTSYAAFKGILESKAIWATDYRFLNDREEFRHCRKLAMDLAALEPEFVGQKFPAREFLVKALNAAFNTGVLREDRLRLMVASFSEQGDQLSQWRGYSGSSTGVSIGLDLRGLRPPAGVHTMVVFAPCVYRDEEKTSLLKAIFALYYETIQSYWDDVISQAQEKTSEPVGLTPEDLQGIILANQGPLSQFVVRAQNHLQADLLRIGSLMKDESFSEEKEWRLALPSEIITMPTQHPIEFRAVRNALVPYVAYPLLAKNQEGPILCNDLILGPGSHPHAEVGVNLLFQTQFITTRARPSKIPYQPA